MNNAKRVQFYAQTIVAKIQLGKLMLGVADFSRTPITAARARISVEFEAGISREEAMAGLTALLKEIEAHGLPKTSLSIHPEHEREFNGILKQYAAAKRQYDRLSSRGQQRWREHCALKNQREDGVLRTLSEELFRLFQWRSETDVGRLLPLTTPKN
jgi:hypothetical protein